MSKFFKVLHFGNAHARRTRVMITQNLRETYLKSGVTINKMDIFQVHAWQVMSR